VITVDRRPDALRQSERRVIANARKSNEALNIALEALMAIGLHRESHEGQVAIEAMRRIRGVMAE
jgi:hypothetical protein